MNGTATRRSATKYRFAGLGVIIVLFLSPRSAGFVASSPYSRAIYGMVLKTYGS